ncbi:unnamed protein product [Medioppia subpectinata]|uniref:Uncharacterized protein n=1 Tax=Medioppia subpectinata TaxID=1979941 RepID=A0A7R9PX75_9ACAR|nr:unnamed protein product [Medioppia subpectinata]CAG2103665.1 unnamed protein product [Medioppia subpectinata]
MQSNEAKSDSCRRFQFTSRQNDINFSININEKYSTSYGYHVWPSAPVLAQFVAHFREEFKDKNIVELGAGTGMVGIVAAKVGAQVVLTDSHQYPECLRLCRQNVDINGVKDNIVAIESLDWGQLDEHVLQMPAFDYILSSDCFYDQKDFEDILSSVSFLIDKHHKKGTIFYTTYQERNSDWSIECLLNKWGLKCDYICLDDFEANTGCIAGSDISSKHTIHLLKITKHLENH